MPKQAIAVTIHNPAKCHNNLQCRSAGTYDSKGSFQCFARPRGPREIVPFQTSDGLGLQRGGAAENLGTRIRADPGRLATPHT